MALSYETAGWKIMGREVNLGVGFGFGVGFAFLKRLMLDSTIPQRPIRGKYSCELIIHSRLLDSHTTAQGSEFYLRKSFK